MKNLPSKAPEATKLLLTIGTASVAASGASAAIIAVAVGAAIVGGTFLLFSRKK